MDSANSVSSRVGGAGPTIGLRVKSDEEADGLGITQHAEAAYACGDFGSMGRLGS